MNGLADCRMNLGARFFDLKTEKYADTWGRVRAIHLWSQCQHALEH